MNPCPLHFGNSKKKAAPYTRKKLNSFSTMNSKIKIRFKRQNEEVNTEINHQPDLVAIFGMELISNINRERKERSTQK